MRITDKTSFDIANESYKKYDIGDEITVSGNDFEIIEKRDDTQNGLRAYAYAPVVNGKVDTSHIYMGYAGTDIKSIRDLFTDLQLPFYNNTSNDKINKRYSDLDKTTITEKYNGSSDKSDFFFKGVPNQIDESVAFTGSVKKKYPNSNFYGGAHSLGALIAQYNAVKYDFDKTTTYAAPNPYGALPKEIQSEIDKGKYDGKIKNVGHEDDIVNSLDFLNPRIGSNIITVPSYSGFLTAFPYIGQHFMSTYDVFDKNGNAKEMSKSELAAYKKMRKFYDQFNILTTDKDPAGLDETISDFIKKLNKKAKADKASKTKKGSKSTSKSSKNVKGDSDASAKKGNGGSGGSGKKIKIQPEAVRAIVSDLRDRIHKYDDVLRNIEEYERETKKSSQRILDKYESELLSGSHKFISPSDLTEYMESLAQGGSIGNLEFYDNHSMEQVVQDIHQNKKTL
ncbi:hypothetical protein, partial [Staphylococcus edaphicus]